MALEGASAARQQKILKPVEVVKVFKETHIPTIEEVVTRIGKRYKRLRPRRRGLKGIIEFEIKRVELVYNILNSTLEKLVKLPKTDQMNEFHKTLIKEVIGDAYDKALEKLRFARRLINQFWDEYRLLIATAENPAEAGRLRKEAVGRMISVWRRLKKHIEVLIKVKEEIVKTHVVAEDYPVIVVAGVPSSGKSTFIRAISTAKPEIAPYPFTTKSIIVGKLEKDNMTYYFVDTPGILDRPLEELNQIERKAIVALRVLADAILFLVDVSYERTLSIESQLNVLDTVRKLVGDKPLTIALSKFDIKDEDAVKQAIDECRKRGLPEPIPLSVVTGLNVDKITGIVIKKAFTRFIKRVGLSLQ